MNAALYLRLSRDDGNVKESESISGQRMLLTDFCKSNGFCIYDEYCDDGYSGTDFERPAFRRMIEDALLKKFSVIITKDMSRLGRDYIKTGEYIEYFFPANGIRYIAVNDNVDTGICDGSADMIPFKAVFNDLYAKDISRKVRSSLEARKRQGRYTGSCAPYGYKMSEHTRGKLERDERCDYIVERIYNEYVNGSSMLAIANTLTYEKVPTPSQMHEDNRKKSEKWNSVIIKRILTNPTYRGHITQGFEKKVSYKSRKRIRIPEEMRITVMNTHEAIVSEELALAVKKIMKK